MGARRVTCNVVAGDSTSIGALRRRASVALGVPCSFLAFFVWTTDGRVKLDDDEWRRLGLHRAPRCTVEASLVTPSQIPASTSDYFQFEAVSRRQALRKWMSDVESGGNALGNDDVDAGSVDSRSDSTEWQSLWLNAAQGRRNMSLAEAGYRADEVIQLAEQILTKV